MATLESLLTLPGRAHRTGHVKLRSECNTESDQNLGHALATSVSSAESCIQLIHRNNNIPLCAVDKAWSQPHRIDSCEQERGKEESGGRSTGNGGRAMEGAAGGW